MKKTHLSLYYLTTYLIASGIMLITVPDLALKLLFSNGRYGDVIPRLTGVIALALGLVVLQIVRLRVEVLYTTLLGVRAVLVLLLIGLYFYSRDPFFLSLTAVVGIGIILTAVGYYLDRQQGATPAQSHA